MRANSTGRSLDDELVRRANTILVRLKLLCEGPAASPPSLAVPATRTRIACPSCRGANCPRCKGRGDIPAPPRHRSITPHHESHAPAPVPSLYDFWLPRFHDALHKADNLALKRCCDRAETDLARHRGQYRNELDLPTDDKEAKEKVAVVYQGMSAVEVARKGGGTISVQWVRHARRLNRRDPDTGLPLEGFRGWPDERRIKEVRRLRLKGHNQQQVANRFGVSPSTLSKLWVKAEPYALPRSA